MKRSLAAGLGLLALAALPASAADLPRHRCRTRRRLLCRRLQLDRLLSRHQRRRRLGRFRLERLRDQQQPVGRHDRRHRRLQLAGRRQPVGVRPRRRHRLDQHQGQRRLRLARSAARPRTTGSAPCAAASATPGIASCRTSPAASRSATSKSTATGFAGVERHQRRLDHRRRHRRRHRRQLDGQGRVSLCRPRRHRPAAPRPAARRPTSTCRLNILRAGLNYRF